MYTFTTFISKRIAEQVCFNDKSLETVLISLNSPPAVTPESSHPKLIEAAWSKILRLEFHDADGSGRSIDSRISSVVENGQLSLFTEEQAAEILRFLRAHQDDHSHAIVHCEGGISRSAAVSKFIAQIYNLEFPEGYSLYNRHVYSTLLRVHGSSLYGEGPLNPKELPGYQLK